MTDTTASALRPGSSPAKSGQRTFLLAVFVVSGLAGLIYESVWSHYLKLFLGHAAYAQTLVLAIFMGGMALGSALVARWSVRIRKLLLAYVAVEVLIGLFGLIFHRLFIVVSDYSLDTLVPAMSGAWSAQALKWVVGALLILPQSMLLGATFPLISGGVIRRWPQRPGATLALLYFTNSLGAAAGVLISGFVLIHLVGLPGTIMTAGLLNLLLALAVWAATRNDAEPRGCSPRPLAQRASMLRHWFTVAAFATGAASLMYEMGWIRMLSLVLGSSTHSFELMLAAFIFGLAVGGLWIRRRIDAITDPYPGLGLAMLATGSLALLTLPAYNSTFDLTSWVMHAVARSANGYTLFNLSGQVLAAMIMVPATFCAGMTLPLLTNALLRERDESAIGVIYGANTVGAIAGVLLAVHLLMPRVGVKGAIIAGALIHIGIGISGLLRAGRSGADRSSLMRSRLLQGASAAAVLILSGCIAFVHFDARRLTAGVYRHGDAAYGQDVQVRYLRDGKTATISLVEHQGMVTIATNGKPDAAIMMAPTSAAVAGDEITMILAAALPLSMHPDPQRIANIGVGSGLTTHTLLASARVRSLDSIEIEPLMVKAARLGFYPRNRNMFDDARSHLHIEDAKTFFSLQREPYDIIVAEPSNPWVSGVASLFSQEFYHRINRYLKPDGLFVQWLQIYETDMSVVASVLKALSSNFADYVVYNVDYSNLLIVASPHAPLPVPSARVFSEPGLRSELEHVNMRSLSDFTIRLIGHKRAIDSLIESYGSPANSDYFPFVDLNAPRLRFMQRTAVELPSTLLFPLPLNEMLNTPQGAFDVPPMVAASTDRSMVQAQALAAALLGGTVESLDRAAAAAVLAVRMDDASCALPGANALWLGGVRSIAENTATRLALPAQKQLWQAIARSPCARGAANYTATWLGLLQSVAMRDTTGMQANGMALLNSPDTLRSPDDLAYAVTAVALADLHSGRDEAAATVIDRYYADGISGAPNLPQAYQLPLRWLRACAATRSCVAP